MLLINSKAKAIQIFNAIHLQSLSSPNCHRRLQSKPPHIYTQKQRERERERERERRYMLKKHYQVEAAITEKERIRTPKRERERESLSETEI